MSGFASTVAQGFAFGTGSAIAHRAVGAAAGAMSGGSSEQVQPYEAAPVSQYPPQNSYGAPQQNNCNVDQQNFMACLNQNAGNADACQFYFESLQLCQRNQAQQGQM